MLRWTLALRFRRFTVASPAFPRQAFHKRFYSSSPPFEPSIERYTVPCASAGEITVSLYNVADRPATDPLIIWIPPFAARDENDPNYHLPSWLHRFSVAVIHYRWSGLYDDERPTPKPKPKPKVKPGADVEPELDDEGYYSSKTSDRERIEEGELAEEEKEFINRTPLHWPTPIHDVLFGYSWITQNLQPKYPKRKDVYICGSYLGASLAAGLALTESYPHARMTVRGLLAYNGIYDWTTFLPDHPIHRPKGDDRILIEEQLHKLNRDLDEDGGPAATSPIIAHYQRRLEDLFGTPSGLFDSFASACLFFHTAGLFIPPTFDEKYVPEWLHPPPPGPLITGGANDTTTKGHGALSDPHDPLTPRQQPPPESPLPPSQNPTDDFDPDNFEHFEQNSEYYSMEMSMENNDLDLDPDNFEHFEQNSEYYSMEMSMDNNDLDLALDNSDHFDHSEQGEPDSVAAADAEDMQLQTLQMQQMSMFNGASGEPDEVVAEDLVQEVTRLQDTLKVQILHAKFPRKSYVHFPPRHSMLKLPDTLLLYETPSAELPFKCDALAKIGVKGSGAMSLSARYQNQKGKQQQQKEEEEDDDVGEDEAEGGDKEKEGKVKEKKSLPRLKTRKQRRPPVAITAGENSFRTQAYELALLMQRSIETLELKERRKWDEDYPVDVHYWELEAARRVKVADVGVVDDQDMEIGDLEGVGDLDERGREIVLEWLEEKMDKTR